MLLRRSAAKMAQVLTDNPFPEVRTAARAGTTRNINIPAEHLPDVTGHYVGRRSERIRSTYPANCSMKRQTADDHDNPGSRHLIQQFEQIVQLIQRRAPLVQRHCLLPSYRLDRGIARDIGRGIEGHGMDDLMEALPQLSR